MDLPVSVIGLASLLALLLYRYIFYPALISPLSRLPTAHPLCSVTSKWFERQGIKGRQLKTLYAAHNKHGPILRLGPTEVSVVSQEGLEQVYIAGLDKDAWWQTLYNYGRQNLVSTLDHKTHSTIRKIIAGLYTKSYVQRSGDMEILSKKIVMEGLLPLLEQHARDKEDVEVMQLFERLGVDQITAYLFGASVSTNFLQDRAGGEKYFGEWSELRKSFDLKAKPITNELFMNMSKASLAVQTRDQKFGGELQPPVFLKLYNEMLSRAEEWNMGETEVLLRCASECMDHVIATQETNTITWTYILYRRSLHPELQKDLRAELRTLDRPITFSQGGTQRLPSPADIDALPLLNAVVHETLRRHTANSAPLPRVAPAVGLSLHGYNIPPATKISSNAYCLHRNPEVFPDPLEWVPERWLPEGDKEEDESKLNKMRKWFWAFGSGPRMCIGQNFAMQGKLE